MSRPLPPAATGDSLITTRLARRRDGALLGLADLIRSADVRVTNLIIERMARFSPARRIEWSGEGYGVVRW